jgi:hypothetical protein
MEPRPEQDVAASTPSPRLKRARGEELAETNTVNPLVKWAKRAAASVFYTAGLAAAACCSLAQHASTKAASGPTQCDDGDEQAFATEDLAIEHEVCLSPAERTALDSPWQGRLKRVRTGQSQGAA